MRGFTQQEQRAILFLLATFGVGAGIWIYRQSQPLPAVNPAEMAVWDEFARMPQSVSAPADSSAQTHIAGAAPQRVDLNAATYNDLVRLPGIGPVMAKRIIAYRETNGPFKRLGDLHKVKGIGAKTYEKLAPLMMVRKE